MKSKNISVYKKGIDPRAKLLIKIIVFFLLVFGFLSLGQCEAYALIIS